MDDNRSFFSSVFVFLLLSVYKNKIKEKRSKSNRNNFSETEFWTYLMVRPMHENCVLLLNKMKLRLNKNTATEYSKATATIDVSTSALLPWCMVILSPSTVSCKICFMENILEKKWNYFCKTMFFKIWAFQNLNNPIKEGPKISRQRTQPWWNHN